MATVIGHCQRCHKIDQLQEHHTRLRSQGGHDAPKAYLCLLCHRKVHDHTASDWEQWIQRTGEQEKEEDVQF